MIQLPYFQSKENWKAPQVQKLPAWPTHGRVGVDTETRDPLLTKLGPGVRRGGYIVGVSFALDPLHAWYLPIRHEGGGNLPPDVVLRYLKDQALSFRGEIVGANLQYDLDYLAEWGVKFHPDVKFRDVQIAAPLIYELHMNYSLDHIAARAGLPLKDEGKLLEAGRTWGLGNDKAIKRQMWKLPAAAVGEYAEYDAILPLMLLKIQEKEIEQQRLGKVWDLETDNLPVALSMRRRGVLIDQEKLQHISDWAEEVEREELAKVRVATGVPVQFGDTQKATLLSQALETIGLKCPLTPKTGKPSVKADFLRRHDHEVTRAILRAKQFAKLRTTFCRQVWDRLCKGRVHCTFNQVRTQKPGTEDLGGAAFGRYSSSDFNIQNQPIRNKEFGKLWRSIYVTDHGALWACADYSSQEPRLAVHFATLLNLPGGATSARRYWEDPTTDPHSLTASMMFPKQWQHLSAYYEMGAEEGGERFEEAKRLRDTAKTLFLGLCYGMGGGKLCSQLGLPTIAASFVSRRTGETVSYRAAGPEGQAVLDQFHARVPFIGKLARLMKERAETRGYVVTISGRRCRFRLFKGEYIETHKGASREIQGSAGDQIKKALSLLYRAGIKLQMTVHDEIDWSTASFEEMRFVGETMVNAVKLKVPSKVDLEYGPSWGKLVNKLH